MDRKMDPQNTQTALEAFITGLPKAELHLHIEGSLEPELMFALARRNKLNLPFKSVEELRAAYNFSNLQDFLNIYYVGAQVLRTEEDFYDLTLAYFARAAADGVVHAEIFFDPQTHTDRGIPFAVAVQGILGGMAAAKARYGVTSELIMCFLRHLDEEAAFATFRRAGPWLDRIIGVGLDSSELGHPPSKFARVFAAAGAAGLKRVAHAGEEGPAAYVWEALDTLHIDRLDHGNRALDDAALVERLAATQMTLTTCPLSNLRLCVVPDMNAHPIDTMLAQGLRATINSDDPAYFGGYIGENFKAAALGRQLDRAQLITLCRNSLLGAFLDDATRQEYLRRLDSFAN
jgi:adenosine deaminase